MPRITPDARVPGGAVPGEPAVGPVPGNSVPGGAVPGDPAVGPVPVGSLPCVLPGLVVHGGQTRHQIYHVPLVN